MSTFSAVRKSFRLSNLRPLEENGQPGKKFHFYFMDVIGAGAALPGQAEGRREA